MNKVLVVDDSAPLQQIYRIVLMRYKFQVIPALSGREGLDKLVENPDVCLLIVDLAMPHMSGSEFIRKVREQRAFEHIPILVVTSSGHERDSAEMSHPIQGSVRKPFTSNELHALIEKNVCISVG